MNRAPLKSRPDRSRYVSSEFVVDRLASPRLEQGYRHIVRGYMARCVGNGIILTGLGTEVQCQWRRQHGNRPSSACCDHFVPLMSEVFFGN